MALTVSFWTTTFYGSLCGNWRANCLVERTNRNSRRRSLDNSSVANCLGLLFLHSATLLCPRFLTPFSLSSPSFCRLRRHHPRPLCDAHFCVHLRGAGAALWWIECSSAEAVHVGHWPAVDSHLREDPRQLICRTGEWTPDRGWQLTAPNWPSSVHWVSGLKCGEESFVHKEVDARCSVVLIKRQKHQHFLFYRPLSNEDHFAWAMVVSE